MKVVDMHCDTVLNLYRGKTKTPKVRLKKNEGHLDLCKMQQGDYLLQNFALFIDLGKNPKPLERCLLLLDTICEEIACNDDVIRLARNYEDIIANQKAGKMSGMLTIEEGGAIQGSLEHLRNFYRLGVRMMTLTWNYQNEIGQPNCLRPDGTRADYGVANTTGGLTPFGFDTVAEMNRLGMIIDVSHLSDAGFYDVLKTSKQPFVASHSNARSICGHVRNMTDDMIRKLSEHGGVMGLNYEPSFLRCVPEGCPSYSKLDVMVEHVKHIVDVGGIECLGLGSDFDGIDTPEVIKDGSCLPLLSDALSKEGFTSSQIEAIFSKNVLRLYQDVLK